MKKAATTKAKQYLALIVFSVFTLIAISMRNDKIERIGDTGTVTIAPSQTVTQTAIVSNVPTGLDSAAAGSLAFLAEPIKDQTTQQSISPTMAASEDLSGSLWKAVFYTSLMLAAILLGANLIKKYGGERLSQTSSSDIEIVGRKYLNPKQSLAIIKVREKELLVGITDHTIQLLDRLDPDEN